jgi:hypothetical protein
MAEDLNRQYPLDTQMQSLWLPAIQAQLALNRKNPADDYPMDHFYGKGVFRSCDSKA